MKQVTPILALLLVLFLAVPASARGCRSGSSMHMEYGMMGSDERMHGGMMYHGGNCGGLMGWGKCGSMGGCRMSILPLLDNVDLSDSQLEEIDDILADAEEQMDSARESAGLMDPHSDFLRMFTTESLTADDLEDFSRRSDLLGEEMAEIHDQTMIRIHDVLTTEQLDQLNSMIMDYDEDISYSDGCRSSSYTRGGCRGGGCR